MYPCLLSHFSCVQLFANCMNCSPTGSSVHENLQARILQQVAMPPPGDLPNPGTEMVSLTSPELAGGFFTTSAPCEAQYLFSSVQFSSVTPSCPTLCYPMNCSTPGLPVHHHLLEFTQTHVHQVGNAIHPSRPLSSPFPLAPNPSQHQSLFQ